MNMTDTDVLKQILDSDSLPILPHVASKLISMVSREDTSVKEIVNLISKDISLSAKLLKVANSAFYSFPNRIRTINQAVSVIGTNGVLSLALSFYFLRINRKNQKDSFDYERFWEKSLGSGVAAKLIKTKIDGIDVEEFFVAGLLLNIGELIIARVLPHEFAILCDRNLNSTEDILEAERDLLGVDHTQIGYEVAKKWNFPEFLLLPIKFHTKPDEYQGQKKNLEQLIEIVYLSELLANILYSNQPQRAYKEFQSNCEKRLGLDSKTIQSILNKVDSEIADTASFFGLKLRMTRSIEDILIEANTALSVMNLSYDQMNKELISTKIQLQKINKELKEKNNQLEKLAYLDGLTGIYNHRYFQEFLDKEISRAKRKQTNLSLIMADVDFFKDFNDRYGHQIGDWILKQICLLIKEYVREYDILARYGGEELAIVLPETSRKQAETIAERFRKIVEEHTFISEYKEYKVTLSFGVSTLSLIQGQSVKDGLITSADKALYKAKKKGRNRVVLFQAKKQLFGKESPDK